MIATIESITPVWDEDGSLLFRSAAVTLTDGIDTYSYVRGGIDPELDDADIQALIEQEADALFLQASIEKQALTQAELEALSARQALRGARADEAVAEINAQIVDVNAQKTAVENDWDGWTTGEKIIYLKAVLIFFFDTLVMMLVLLRQIIKWAKEKELS